MFTIVIQEKGGEARRLVFTKPEVTIGRVQGNDIVLPKGNVSKRHARIVLKDGKFIIVDLKSTNGTYVNGKKISHPHVVKDSDKIYIGDFVVGVDESGAGEPGEMAGALGAPAAGPGLGTEADPGPGAQLGGGTFQAPGVMMPPAMVAPAPMPVGPAYGAAPAAAPNAPFAGPGASGPASTPFAGPGPSAAAPAPRPSFPSSGPPIGPGPGFPAPSSAPAPGFPARKSGGTQPPPNMGPAGLGGLGGAPVQGGAMPPAPAPLGGPGFGAAPAHAAPSANSGPAPAPGVGPASIPTPYMGPNSGAAGVGPRPSSGAPVAGPAPTAAPARPQGQALPQALPQAQAKRSVPVVEALDAATTKQLDFQGQMLQRLRGRIDLAALTAEQLGDEQVWQRVERTLHELIDAAATGADFPRHVGKDVLVKECLNEALGLGPLEDLLSDDGLDEVIVERRDRILIASAGGPLRASGRGFASEDAVRRVTERLGASVGVDVQGGVVEMRLRDGSAVTALLPPVASGGGVLAIRKARANGGATLATLQAQGALSGPMSDLLLAALSSRRNIVVCGTGRQQLLTALSHSVTAGERVVVLDGAELGAGRDGWLALDSRSTSDRGAGIWPVIEAVQRLRPDRVVIGELLGPDIAALISATAGPWDGALIASAGDGTTSCLDRICAMVRPAYGNADYHAVRALVAAAIDIVVHTVRGQDGALRVQQIDEVISSGERAGDSMPLFVYRDGNHVAQKN